MVKYSCHKNRSKWRFHAVFNVSGHTYKEEGRYTCFQLHQRSVEYLSARFHLISYRGVSASVFEANYEQGLWN